MRNHLAPSPRDSRVLLFSQRGVCRNTWQAAQYEFEDLVLKWDDAVLLAPPPQAYQFERTSAARLANAVHRRVGSPRRTPHWPAATMARQRVETQHDLFFAVFHYPDQLAYLNQVDGWRERVRTAVCFLIELWPPQLEDHADYLEMLRQFDLVYVFNPTVAAQLSGRLSGTPTAYLPMGVDAVTMAPHPERPQRPIDVYSYGRRSPRVHQDLLRLVHDDGLIYLYDTLTDATFRQHSEHRLHLANVMKRSKYFLAHSINDSVERRARTGGVEALSSRYFEGAAGGAVMLGSRPDTHVFSEAFPWDDAVVPLPHDDGDVASLLAELEAQPARTARIRTSNVRGSLLTHDWAHRWRRLLEDVGMSSLPALTARLDLLPELAAAFMEDEGSYMEAVL